MYAIHFVTQLRVPISPRQRQKAKPRCGHVCGASEGGYYCSLALICRHNMQIYIYSLKKISRAALLRFTGEKWKWPVTPGGRLDGEPQYCVLFGQ
jgi:hypothetical protein